MKHAIPVGADTRRLRFLFDAKSGATPSSGIEEYWDGDINWVTPEDLGKLVDRYVRETRRRITEEGYKNCAVSLEAPGSIVLSKRAPIGQTAILAVPAACNQGCFLLTKRSDIDERFYYYALIHLRPALESLGRGSTFMELSADDLRSVPLPFPSEKDQEVVANYLDREIARIDGLIAEKGRMLALLEEKRAVLISRVVTRGLDPDAPLKPSGQEWLGEIPPHWRVERAKNLFSVRDERSEDGSEELLTVSHITGVTSRSEKDVYMFQADDKAGYKRCLPGDLAINTLWAWMGAMGISPLEGIVSPDYHVYISKGDLLPEYVDLLCRSRPFVAEVNRWSKGVWSSRLRLYPENFFEMRLPVPSHGEQRAIVDAIQSDEAKANQLRDALQTSIGLAKERRAALITAAVTGQITQEEMTE
ncbi:restriction endonuclease subunit S [Burkholderia anthina]|uniref:restriction endonuclease subunit S n=1 Tax=Burkholderia anthina TaxID=179879 RepID=UPI000F5F2E59|nr:restriction endonuclease subunit S [Burkholderia anthina]RQX79650.1 restriction endonuclease subunit S [Burkholderia anthina]